VYNPSRNEKSSSEPVTYWSYKISGRKEDVWLAIIGCIADHHMPDFAFEFIERYPDLWGDVEEPFDAYYKTEIGKIAQALNFGLKDSISNVVRLQNFLIEMKDPRDVFSEAGGNYHFRRKYKDTREKYEQLLGKAKEGEEWC